MVNLRSRPHLSPKALTPGYGSQALSGTQAYFRGLNRPLAIGGAVLLIAALLAQLVPPSIRSSNVFNGALAGCLGLYAIVGFLFLRTKFRITAPAFILALIQIWIVVTVFISPSVFSLELKLGRNIWWPAFVLMPYLVAFVLVAIEPRFRTRLLNFILGVCAFTALVGVLQFIRFPGAYQLSMLYTDLDSLIKYDLGLEKRSHGLSTHPFHLAAQCILGCGIVASQLLFRKLTAWEVFLYALLSAGLIVAQARSFYAVWVFLTIFTLIFVFKRSKPQGLIIVCLMSSIIVGAIGAFPDQLTYGLSGKNTIEDGRMGQWNRADSLSEQYPVTGIGPKETVFGSGKDFSGGGRWWTPYTESGYRMSRVSGGVVGLFLLISLVGTSIFLSLKVFRDESADPVRRRAAFAGFYYMIAMAVGLYITNIVESELMTYYGMALAGIIAPQIGELYRSKKGRTNRYMKRIFDARARLAANARVHEVPNP